MRPQRHRFSSGAEEKEGGDYYGRQQRSDEREGGVGGIQGDARSEVQRGCEVSGSIGAYAASQPLEATGDRATGPLLRKQDRN